MSLANLPISPMYSPHNTNVNVSNKHLHNRVKLFPTPLQAWISLLPSLWTSDSTHVDCFCYFSSCVVLIVDVGWLVHISWTSTKGVVIAHTLSLMKGHLSLGHQYWSINMRAKHKLQNQTSTKALITKLSYHLGSCLNYSTLHGLQPLLWATTSIDSPTLTTYDYK